MEKKGHTYVQWIVAILANSNLLTYGLQAGWVSPMTKILQSPNSPTGVALTDSDIGWVASLICLAAMLATPVYAYVADRFGRKVVLIAIPFLQATAWLIKLSTGSVSGLMAARAVSGLAAGGCFNVIPMYTREIAQDDIRGMLGTLLFMFQNIGFLIMYAIGMWLDYYTVLWAVAALPALAMLLLTRAPESPAYLMRVGKVEELTATLCFLRGLSMDDKQLQSEIEQLKNEKTQMDSMPELTYSTIFKDQAYRRIFLIIIAVISVQSCNGTFSILTYAASIMEGSGTTISPELQALSFPAVMLLGSFTSMACVERLGRRILMVTFLILTVLSMATLGSSILVQSLGGPSLAWLPGTTIVAIVFAYGAGVSPVTYVAMTEIFNNQVRAKLMGIIITYAWFISFVQLLAFSSISNALGLHTTFFGFAIVNLIGVFIVLTYLPETKGKNIEEIERDLRGK